MRRYSTDKDLNKFCNEMVAEGWNITIANNGHLRWRHPSGASMYSAQSPSCSRTVDNVKRDMRRALLKAGVNTYPRSQEAQAFEEQKIERREKKMQEPLTQKITIPKPLPAPTVTPARASAREDLHWLKVRKMIRELMAKGKSAPDAVTVMLTAYRPIVPNVGNAQSGKSAEIGFDKMLKFVTEPMNLGGAVARKAKAEKAAKEAPPKRVKPPRPAPIEAPAAAGIESEIDDKLRHVRAVIHMPFDKQKKIEIIIDLLDKLL